MNRVFSFALLLLTIHTLLLGGFCVALAQRIYPFAIAFVVAAAICLLFGAAAVVWNGRVTSLAQNGCVAATVVLFVLAVLHWSGGDDGPGMLLVGVVGPIQLAASVLAVVSTISTIRTFLSSNGKATSNDPTVQTSQNNRGQGAGV
jgi:hypothetical protein